MFVLDRRRDDNGIVKKPLVLQMALQHFGIVAEDRGGRQDGGFPDLVFQPVFEPFFPGRRSGDIIDPEFYANAQDLAVQLWPEIRFYLLTPFLLLFFCHRHGRLDLSLIGSVQGLILRQVFGFIAGKESRE
jgi:hypothetical protein